MKRVMTILVPALGALAFAATSFAGDGRHDGGHDGDHHANRGHHEGEHHGDRRGNGTFVFRTNLTTTDTGTCQNQWANDTLTRTYVVKPRSDGSFVLVAFDRGTFTTLAGQSPGACETTDTNHGLLVTPGVTGKVRGFIAGIVTGGTFNPNATCGTNCFRSTFISSFFGPTAKFSCDTDQSCRFEFNYRSDDSTLAFDHWRDRGRAENGVLTDVLKGDIATS
jgi:hypothetical protein